MYKILIFLFGFSLACRATTITATITDTDSQTWNNGNYSISLINPRPDITPSVNGVPLTSNQLQQKGYLNSSGVLTATLVDNTTISPIGTTWTFTICPNASSPCGSGITAVAGSSQNLSTFLSSIIHAPRFPAIYGSYGYSDIEVTVVPNNGAIYFNVTSGPRYCTLVMGTCTWANLSNNAYNPTNVAITGGTIANTTDTNQTISGATISSSTLTTTPITNSTINNTPITSSAINSSTIGGTSPAAITGTIITGTTSLNVPTITSTNVGSANITAANILSNNVNYIVSADSQTGSDIGAKINNAFLSQAGISGTPTFGVEVNLNPNQNYSYSTPIVIPTAAVSPYIVRPVLDCHNSTLTFTGSSGDGVTVLAENAYNSGEIRNCVIVFSNTAATFHIYSRTFWKMTHDTLELGLTGITIENTAAAGANGYTEEQVWDTLEINVPVNGSGITFVNDVGVTAGSFFYNFFKNIHFDLNGTSNGFNLTYTSSAPEVQIQGGNFDLHVNTGGSNDSVFYLGNSTGIIRSSVDISGENDGSTPVYDVYASTNSSVFFAFGKSYLTGVTGHGYGSSVPLSNIVWQSGPALISDDLGSTNLSTRTISQEPQSTASGRICGNFQVGGVTAFLLAQYGGTENDCQWEVGYRHTTDPAPDVDQALSSGFPIVTNIYTDSLGNVGIGPGWSTSSEPGFPLTVNGLTKVTNIIVSPSTPADTATCTAGTIYTDASFIYVCTASGTVKRAALSTF